MAKLRMWSQKEVITNTRWWFEVSSEEKFIINLINCLMNRDPNVSYNAAAEQVQFFFILQFVIKHNVRSQEIFLLYLFTFMHLADAFIQSDLHSGYTFSFFLSVCVFPGNQTHNLCVANAMLYHWATGTESVEILLIIVG